MTTESTAPDNAPDGQDPAPELIDELLRCGWIPAPDAPPTGTVRAVILASPSRTLTLRLETDGDRVQLVFHAPARRGDRFCYAWAATAPLLDWQVVLAVAAANDADATFSFDENDALDLDFLTACGWRQENDGLWEHPDGRILAADSGDPDHPGTSISIRRDSDEQPIRTTQHVSNQALQALTDPTAEPADGDRPTARRRRSVLVAGQPGIGQEVRRMLLRDVAEKILARKAEAETFTVPPGWSGAGTPSERGQQHIRLALALTGVHEPLGSPELFDQVVATIPAVIADLHALAARIGLDPQRLTPPPRHR